MSARPVTASGTWFLSRKTKPHATRAADGLFCLTLLVFDRQGPHTVEPCRASWFGNDAFDFHALHAQLLQPGVPLELELIKLRCFSAAGKHSSAEFHATVKSLQVLPFASKSSQYLQDKTAPSPCLASINSY